MSTHSRRKGVRDDELHEIGAHSQSLFRGSLKLSKRKCNCNHHFATYNLPKIDSILAPGHKYSETKAYTYIIEGTISVIISDPSSLPHRHVYVWGNGPKRKNANCAEIALIKWWGLWAMIMMMIISASSLQEKRNNLRRDYTCTTSKTRWGFCFWRKINISKLWCVWSGNNEFPSLLCVASW